MKVEDESLKMIQMNSFMKQKQSHRSRENKLTVTKGKMGEG